MKKKNTHNTCRPTRNKREESFDPKINWINCTQFMYVCSHVVCRKRQQNVVDHKNNEFLIVTLTL